MKEKTYISRVIEGNTRNCYCKSASRASPEAIAGMSNEKERFFTVPECYPHN